MTMQLTIPTSIQSRDYQIRIVKNTLAAIDHGHKSILIEGPTGSGKTIIGHLIASALNERHNYITGWCAMRVALWHQARAMNNDMLGFDFVRYFSLFDSKPPKIDVLIEDEGHHSATASSATLQQRVKPKIHIGLTATPERTDRMKLCFSKVIKDAGIRALVDQGWLSPYHQFIFKEDWTPESVANCYADDPKKWGKSVIYFLTRVECESCQKILRDRGVESEVVWGGSDQEAQIDRFKNGDLDVLINMVILTEGFDAPMMKSVFVRPGSQNPTVQMAGRVLRKYDGLPFKQIVQNFGGKWPFTRIASCEEKFVRGDSGVWENRGRLSEDVAIASFNTMLAISHIKVDIPQSIKKHYKKRKAT